MAETNVACSSFGTFLHLFFVAFKSHIAAAMAAPLALTLCSEGLFYNIALRMLDDHVLLDYKNPSLNIRSGQLRSFRVGGNFTIKHQAKEICTNLCIT